MKADDLKSVFGSHAATGRVFAPFNDGKPLTRAAVSQWGEKVPDLREYQLRELFPDIDKRIQKARAAQ